MVGTAVEAAAMAETVEAAEAMGMEAAVEAVVWDTVETAARRPEIAIEEQPEQSEPSIVLLTNADYYILSCIARSAGVLCVTVLCAQELSSTFSGSPLMTSIVMNLLFSLRLDSLSQPW